MRTETDLKDDGISKFPPRFSFDQTGRNLFSNKLCSSPSRITANLEKDSSNSSFFLNGFKNNKKRDTASHLNSNESSYICTAGNLTNRQIIDCEKSKRFHSRREVKLKEMKEDKFKVLKMELSQNSNKMKEIVSNLSQCQRNNDFIIQNLVKYDHIEERIRKAKFN